MKLTKALCLVAATAALALAPINTSTGQTNTVLASQISCTPLRGGWSRCTDGQGRVFDTFDHNYQPPRKHSWLTWFFSAFYSVWSTLSGLFG